MKSLKEQAISQTEREIAYLRGRVDWAKSVRQPHRTMRAELQLAEERLQKIIEAPEYDGS